jgi:DNA-binding NarL/FixJ family response regulator
MRARALTELGAALRRGNRRADAREPLAAGLELAERCGASALAERAREELIATGARPRRAMRTGVDALTPGERRVASLAAGGQTNRDIAQALFVTEKTIETHLSHAYRKLDIHSRSQLTSALAARPPD